MEIFLLKMNQQKQQEKLQRPTTASTTTLQIHSGFI